MHKGLLCFIIYHYRKLEITITGEWFIGLGTNHLIEYSVGIKCS